MKKLVLGVLFVCSAAFAENYSPSPEKRLEMVEKYCGVTEENGLKNNRFPFESTAKRCLNKVMILGKGWQGDGELTKERFVKVVCELIRWDIRQGYDIDSIKKYETRMLVEDIAQGFKDECVNEMTEIVKNSPLKDVNSCDIAMETVSSSPRVEDNLANMSTDIKRAAASIQ